MKGIDCICHRHDLSQAMVYAIMAERFFFAIKCWPCTRYQVPLASYFKLLLVIFLRILHFCFYHSYYQDFKLSVGG